MFKLHTQLHILAGEDLYGEQEWKKNKQSEGHSRSSRRSDSALNKMVEMGKSEESENSIVLIKPMVFDLKILKYILSKSIMLSIPHVQKSNFK